MTDAAIQPTREASSTARYALFLLMIVYTFSFLDRQIVSILAEDIKRDLELTDTQIGVLTGFAFALFYATLGLPIARLADKYNRVKIISICLALWSAMTVMCGLAANFVQLALARMGVGVGEAGALPSSHSLIADYFPPEKRSSAMAVFQLGVPFGVLLGFLAGGWVNEWFGWRWALILIGAPGVALAIVVYLTVKEPPRTQAPSQEQDSILKQIKMLWSHPSYRQLCYAATLGSMGAYAILSWTPAYMIRTFDLTTSYVGTALALLVGVGGGIGTYLGGVAGDKAAEKSQSGPLKVAAAVCFGALPFFILGFLANSPLLMLLFVAPAFFLYMSWMGPNWAMVQAVSPPETRAMASAFILFILNLIGLGFGPLAVGFLSDFFASQGAENGLRWAIICAFIIYPWAGMHFLLARKGLAEAS